MTTRNTKVNPLAETESAGSLLINTDWQREFDSVLIQVAKKSESGAEVARKACELFLDKSDASGLETLYKIACGLYTTDYQSKRYEEASKIAEAWGAIYDQASRKLSRHGFSLQAISLRSVGSGNKIGEIKILTKSDANAIQRDMEREKKERIARTMQDQQQAQKAQQYEAMKSLTACDIANILRPMLSASGVAISDLIVSLCDEEGQAIRQIGKWLYAYKSLAEKAQYRETAAKKREQAKTAKLATKQQAILSETQDSVKA